MDPEQATKLTDALVQAIRQQNEKSVLAIADKLINPVVMEMAKMGQAMAGLMALIRGNRRDVNATEAMKAIVGNMTPEDFLKLDPEGIAEAAYRLAEDMEKRALTFERMTGRASPEESPAERMRKIFSSEPGKLPDE